MYKHKHQTRRTRPLTGLPREEKVVTVAGCKEMLRAPLAPASLPAPPLSLPAPPLSPALTPAPVGGLSPMARMR